MKERITEKAYFKKYYKKITIQYDKAKSLPKYNYFSVHKDKKLQDKYSKYYKISLKEQSKLLNLGIDCKISIGYNSSIMFIYYNDDSIEGHIDKDFSIIEKYKPLNNQEELQSMETNSIIRKKYFFSKYKYRLHFNLTNLKWYTSKAKQERKEKYNEIVNYFKDVYKDNFNEKIREGNFNVINPILYVADEDDVFYLKLMYDTSIIKIDMIILEDEVVKT